MACERSYTPHVHRFPEKQFLLAWAPAYSPGLSLAQYRIEILAGDEWTELITVPATPGVAEETFEHLGLDPLTSYSYRLVAENAIVRLPPSGITADLVGRERARNGPRSHHNVSTSASTGPCPFNVSVRTTTITNEHSCRCSLPTRCALTSGMVYRTNAGSVSPLIVIKMQ